MNLSGQQRRQLQEALIDAFPTTASLEQMLLFELDKNLRVISGEGSLQEIVFRLIRVADSQGWLENLVRAARNSNPGNIRLRDLDSQSSRSMRFDVFLAHNSQDKPQVREIAEELKRRGIKTWLDEEQIRPGRPFQAEIQQAIPLVKSAAIFIGSQGLGMWQQMELRSLISRCIDKEIPIIPVLLPGVSKIPDNLDFLTEFKSVNFLEGIDDKNALNLLEWGITGKKAQIIPQLERKPGKIPTEEILQIISSSENEVLQSETVKLPAESIVIKSDTRTCKAEYFEENLGDGVTLEMVKIRGGTFIMGADEKEEGSTDKERPTHKVTLKPFSMGKYTITQKQWKKVAAFSPVNRDLNLKPSRFKEEEEEGCLPVESISWFDAVEFCDRLSEKTGRKYRLPTEAEWEYACRAGTQEPFYFGKTITADVANFDDSNAGEGKWLKKTTIVGHFKANNFCLHDMHGNVWEWCQDEWHESYKDAPTDGSAWITDNNQNNQYRLLRGGSWSSDPEVCRSAYRLRSRSDNDNDSIGFRVVAVHDVSNSTLNC